MINEVDPDEEVIHLLNAATCGMIAADGYGATVAEKAGDEIGHGKAHEGL